MPDVVDHICADLEIKIIECRETNGPMRTKAAGTLRQILEEHGAGHLILVLRTITESEGNAEALTAPIIWAISDLLAAHTAWGDRGLAWIEAFDAIDLTGLYKLTKANRAACAPRAAMATLLHAHLSPLFDPPAKPKRVKKPYLDKRGPRAATLARMAEAA